MPFESLSYYSVYSFTLCIKHFHGKPTHSLDLLKSLRVYTQKLHYCCVGKKGKPLGRRKENVNRSSSAFSPFPLQRYTLVLVFFTEEPWASPQNTLKFLWSGVGLAYFAQSLNSFHGFFSVNKRVVIILNIFQKKHLFSQTIQV